MEKVFGFTISYIACLAGVVLGILVSSLYSDMSLSEEMTSIRPYASTLMLTIVLVALRNFRDSQEEWLDGTGITRSKGSIFK